MAGTRDQLDSMPPWDAAAYFQQPKESAVAAGMNPVQLVKGDPNRVGMMVSNTSGSTMIISTTQQSGFGTTGLVVPASQLPVILLFSELGPLVQQAWFVNGGQTGTLVVWEISLYRWPDAASKAKEVIRAGQSGAAQRDDNRNGHAAGAGAGTPAGNNDQRPQDANHLAEFHRSRRGWRRHTPPAGATPPSDGS